MTAADSTRWPARAARLARRWGPVLFAALVLLLVGRARSIDWAEVWRAFGRQSPATLVEAAGVAAVAYGLYAGYELLARRHIGHRLPATRAAAIGAISYAFNLSLGSLIGGLGFRYRLYTRHGLQASTAMRVIAFSIFSNWLGYLGLAGVVFASGQLRIADGWLLLG